MPASSLSLPNFRPWVCFPHGWPTEPPWACLDCFVLHASQDQQQIPCHPTVFELITFHVFFHGFGSQHLPLCLRYWRRLLLIFLLLSSCPDPHRRHSKFYKYLFLIMYMHVCLSVGVCTRMQSIYSLEEDIWVPETGVELWVTSYGAVLRAQPTPFPVSPAAVLEVLRNYIMLVPVKAFLWVYCSLKPVFVGLVHKGLLVLPLLSSLLSLAFLLPCRWAQPTEPPDPQGNCHSRGAHSSEFF